MDPIVLTALIVLIVLIAIGVYMVKIIILPKYVYKCVRKIKGKIQVEMIF